MHSNGNEFLILYGIKQLFDSKTMS
jgi:hypothetical protein